MFLPCKYLTDEHSLPHILLILLKRLPIAEHSLQFRVICSWSQLQEVLEEVIRAVRHER